ncbi:hypothetical protein CE143_02640 [Photorhabdus luminescens]|uniref:Transposase n=1 Tax=Photorhabdus akhurstii TaxID=171438 RepID=A0ABX8LRK9_9GAMM|nr:MULTISPECIES: hypothetical protein [Photorhabdus]NRN28202.1 hypothetical protein [Photorhabdus heterorhabditis subsp. aluminescens]QXF32196.1 hypothetical protein B0X70_02655 [Photorhabdus akhurstii]UJD73987.1 hypothetical protein CE143_02640 [Photorhabdus luminescens]
MAKHLSKKDIAAIVNLIRGWEDSKLTWSAICSEAQPLIGKLPTRQSLNAHDAITTAYQTKKDALKGKAPKKPRPASLNAAASRIANLEAELAELKEQNRKYKQLFVVWQYNAYKHGMKESQLNMAMPKIDRERSDKETR